MPLASTNAMAGILSLPAVGRSATSITSILLKPVSSSVLDLTVTPSSISENYTMPSTSVMIGLVYGSQPATLMPGSILVSFFTNNVDP